MNTSKKAKIFEELNERFDFNFVAFNGFEENLEQKLISDFNINKLDVEDILTRTQLPKIELRENYIYISIHFPEYNERNQKFVIKELHFLINHHFLILIDKDNLEPLNNFELIEAKTQVNLKTNTNEYGKLIGKIDDKLKFTPTKLFYEILDFLITSCFFSIANFKTRGDDLEERLFDFQAGEEDLKEILIQIRNLITFTGSIKPIEELLKELIAKKHSFITEEGLELADDSLDKIKKILNNLDIFEKQMRLLMTTNESIIRRKTNESIEYLTTTNLLIAVPTLITSFFGMNVYFGWDVGKDWGPIVGVAVFGISATIIIYLYYKNKNLI